MALVSPYYGVLVWTWLAYFNPHRYAWGVAHDFPVAIVMAIPTLMGTIFAAKNRNFLTRESLMLCTLWAWFVVTTVYVLITPAFAGHAAEAKEHLAESKQDIVDDIRYDITRRVAREATDVGPCNYRQLRGSGISRRCILHMRQEANIRSGDLKGHFSQITMTLLSA